MARNRAAPNIAHPAPLGLFSFALTTFVISCYNAGIFGVSATDPINAIVTLGLFYGGGAQALAGMWAFVYGDAFAATAFTSYGAFWISYSAIFVPAFGVSDAYLAGVSNNNGAQVLAHAKAIYLLGWTIFTFIMFLGSVRTSTALCALFALVATTFTLLTTAEFGQWTAVHRAGGFVGLLTAAVAWYNALGELLENQPDALFVLPLGKHVVGEHVEDGWGGRGADGREDKDQDMGLGLGSSNNNTTTHVISMHSLNGLTKRSFFLHCFQKPRFLFKAGSCFVFV